MGKLASDKAEDEGTTLADAKAQFEVLESQHLRAIGLLKGLAKSSKDYREGSHRADLVRIEGRLESLRSLKRTLELTDSSSLELLIKREEQFSREGFDLFVSRENQVKETKKVEKEALKLQADLVQLQSEADSKKPGFELFQTLDRGLYDFDDALRYITEQGRYRPRAALLETELIESSRGIREALGRLRKDPQVLKEYLKHLIKSVFAGNLSYERASYLDPIAEVALEDQVLIAFTEKPSVGILFNELEVKPLLYKIPSALLGLKNTQYRIDALSIKGLSSSVVETLIVLYRDDAYPTLEAAKLAALALEE